MERITSRENPQIKQLTKLIAQKKERTRTGLFVAEGARIAADAVKSGLAVEQLFLTPQARERYPQEAPHRKGPKNLRNHPGAGAENCQYQHAPRGFLCPAHA